jgi:Tfp pilus assembly protein PilX
MKQFQPRNGFALPTLMVMLALASIATLLALRNLWVNDQLLNAQADQLRNEHKANAVLPVALADILGTATNTDGTTNLRHTSGNNTQSHVFFPSSMPEYDMLRQRLNTGTCSRGICLPHALDANALKASYWKAQTEAAMPVSALNTPYGDHTAWYWVEVFPQLSDSAANVPSSAPFIYRITTLATGAVPGSATVLQAIWVRNTPTSNTGQWRSWHVLHD